MKKITKCGAPWEKVKRLPFKELKNWCFVRKRKKFYSLRKLRQLKYGKSPTSNQHLNYKIERNGQ